MEIDPKLGTEEEYRRMIRVAGERRAKGALDASVRRLAQDYHQNMFQFYDWFWRHEKLIERQNGSIRPSWQDMFGRTNSVQVIRDLLDSA